MRDYIIPFFLLALLFGCMGSKPQLSVSLSNQHPEQLYAGDASNFSITVANSGAAANDAVVELLVNGYPLDTRTLSLDAGSNQTFYVSWTPLSAGYYNVTALVDPGNILSESSQSKTMASQLYIAPAEQPNVFSLLPDKYMADAGLFDITEDGLQALYNYSPTMSELPPYFTFFRPYIRYAKELQIGTVDYNDSSKAVAVIVRGPLSTDQVYGILSMVLNANLSVQNELINGKNISVFTLASQPPFLVCAWREKGLVNMVTYQDAFALETCENITGVHTTTNASALLAASSELVQGIPANTTLLGETSHISNQTTAQYGAAFEDYEGFYGYYITKQPNTTANQTCSGRITNRSMMQLCETMPTANVSWTFGQRIVGNYSITCISAPKSDQATIPIEMKALDICYAFNFSGPEGTWNRLTESLNPKTCVFPETFNCTSYDYQNMTLLLNLTQNRGETVLINGFKCSQEKTMPTNNFQLAQPVTLEPNSTISINARCYDSFGGVKEGDLVYFNAWMYLNYSIQGSDESKVIAGNLTIRKI